MSTNVSSPDWCFYLHENDCLNQKEKDLVKLYFTDKSQLLRRIRTLINMVNNSTRFLNPDLVFMKFKFRESIVGKYINTLLHCSKLTRFVNALKYIALETELDDEFECLYTDIQVLKDEYFEFTKIYRQSRYIQEFDSEIRASNLESHSKILGQHSFLSKNDVIDIIDCTVDSLVSENNSIENSTIETSEGYATNYSIPTDCDVSSVDEKNTFSDISLISKENANCIDNLSSIAIPDLSTKQAAVSQPEGEIQDGKAVACMDMNAYTNLIFSTFENVVIDESNCHDSDNTNDIIDDSSLFLHVLYASKKFQVICISNTLSLISNQMIIFLDIPQPTDKPPPYFLFKVSSCSS